MWVRTRALAKRQRGAERRREMDLRAVELRRLVPPTSPRAALAPLPPWCLVDCAACAAEAWAAWAARAALTLEVMIIYNNALDGESAGL